MWTWGACPLSDHERTWDALNGLNFQPIAVGDRAHEVVKREEADDGVISQNNEGGSGTLERER